jgi:hypothetical protein
MRKGLRAFGIIRGRLVIARAHPTDPWAERLAQLAGLCGEQPRAAPRAEGATPVSRREVGEPDDPRDVGA